MQIKLHTRMKAKLFLLIFILIGCRPDKGQNEKGAYKIEYNCIKGHYESDFALTHSGKSFYYMPIVVYVCDSEQIDTTYLTLKSK